jgi:hypothetical protein
MPQLRREVLAGAGAPHKRAIEIKAGESPSRGWWLQSDSPDSKSG